MPWRACRRPSTCAAGFSSRATAPCWVRTTGRDQNLMGFLARPGPTTSVYHEPAPAGYLKLKRTVGSINLANTPPCGGFQNLDVEGFPKSASGICGSAPLISPLLLRGHPKALSRCPLLGVKRTSQECAAMSAYDPKQTFLRPIRFVIEPRIRGPKVTPPVTSPMFSNSRFRAWILDLGQIQSRCI